MSKVNTTGFYNCLVLFCVCLLSHVRIFATPWTVSCQAPLSIGFSRQEYWSGLPFPPPGDLPYPEVEPMSPALTGGFFTTEPPGKPTKEHLHPKLYDMLRLSAWMV